jgi:hypothetical protein
MQAKVKTLPWPHNDTHYVAITLTIQETQVLQRAADIAADIQEFLPTNGQDEYLDEAYLNAAEIQSGITELLATPTITSRTYPRPQPAKG